MVSSTMAWGFQLGWVVIVIISEASLVYSGNINTLAGPYRIIPGHLERCPSDMCVEEHLDVHFTGFRSRKNTDCWVYNGNFTTDFEWNDQLIADIRMASWSARGGWKDNAHVIKIKKICEAQRNFLPTFNRSLMLAMYGDVNRKCPFAPGTYVINNVTADLFIKPVPTFFYGKWRTDLKLLDPETEKCLGCMRFFVETTPKVNEQSICDS